MGYPSRIFLTRQHSCPGRPWESPWATPDAGDCPFDIGFAEACFPGFRPGLGKQLVKFFQLRRSYSFENDRVALPDYDEMVALLQPEVFADIFGDDDLSLRRKAGRGVGAHG